jgi:RND family efflux transporter MFP subunit
MKRAILVLVVLAAAGAGIYYYTRNGNASAAADNGGNRSRQGGPGGGGGGFGGFGGPGGFGPPGGFGGPRMPMTVELAPVKRGNMAQEVVVVGSLIGAATVEALPKVAGRLESVNVRLGDHVTKGQTLAKVEDREIIEQVKQAKAAYDVAAATVKQREALLKQAQANLERTRNLFERQLIPKQTYDDSQAAYDAAAAQLDLATAQFAQSKARLDELEINLANTVIPSPVTGFVGRRLLDPGAWVAPGGINAAFISVVDITIVRLVANIVEKDLHKITQGLHADVEVDALPGDKFSGRVARVSPVLDPATRTAQIEIEIDNPQYRLKPGMYAKVHFTVEHRDNVLVIPTTALVDTADSRGVFLPAQGDQGPMATFRKVETGLVDQDRVEIVSGLSEGETIVTTGAAALREGDRILLPGQNTGAGGGRGGRGGRRGGGPGGGESREGGRRG